MVTIFFVNFNKACQSKFEFDSECSFLIYLHQFKSSVLTSMNFVTEIVLYPVQISWINEYFPLFSQKKFRIHSCNDYFVNCRTYTYSTWSGFQCFLYLKPVKSVCFLLESKFLFKLKILSFHCMIPKFITHWLYNTLHNNPVSILHYC